MKIKNVKKGQVSLELLVMVFFITVIFLPILYFFYLKASETSIQSSNEYALSYADAIYSAAYSVYYAGNNSYVIITLNIPKGIKSIDVSSIKDENKLLIIEAEGGNVTKIMPTNTIIEGMSKEKLINPGIREINISYNGTIVIKAK